MVLGDGTLAELLTCEQMIVAHPGSQACCAVLMVADKCVGVKVFVIGSRTGSQRIVLEDFDNDGIDDVGFEVESSGMFSNRHARKLRGDARDWLGVFKIEHDGFKSLLPEDKSAFP